jgi:hypothetical protein
MIRINSFRNRLRPLKRFDIRYTLVTAQAAGVVFAGITAPACARPAGSGDEHVESSEAWKG